MGNVILMGLLALFSLLVLLYAVAAYLLPRGRGWEDPIGFLLLPLSLAGLAFAGYRFYRVSAR